MDTPGFSALDLKLSYLLLKDTFVEFKKYPCPFKNCLHIEEKDCAIKQAVKNGKILASRYDNYLKLGGKE